MEDWKTGLFDCTNDTRVCCISFLWPQLQVMHQLQMIDQRQCSVSDCLVAHCCLQFATYAARHGLKKDRYEFGEESIVKDCLVSCCCTCCAIHQQTMEIHLRGDKPAGLFMN